ncbi:hypothetical protein Nit79A3_1192 [Nitrosomonas sp. Is79A3]|uniref:hypothetical protein n=1 Tax=Nitrosomonas sp. (strain Is79A3) TaxID=261292 RepID=UPI000215CB5E
MTESISKQMMRRILQMVISYSPIPGLKCSLRSLLLKAKDGLHPSLLCQSGEIVVLVGVHRIDTVMEWSESVGATGKLVLVEAIPRYLDNIKYNLETHLNWGINNIVYVAKGVSSRREAGNIEVGRKADFNKLAGRRIEDGLSGNDFIGIESIELDTLDNIMFDLGIYNINHIHMTISGLELEALKGMTRILDTRDLSILIRSLHSKDGELLHSQVMKELKKSGLHVIAGKKVQRTAGRNIYAFRD